MERAVLLIIISNQFFVTTCHKMPELQQVNVIFRHGDRTPTNGSRFPTDPNYESDFHPIGYGGLTNAGKLRSFELGEFLRKRYRTFIGDTYFSDLVYARTTKYNRTKMSLQLVLAALFPHVNEQNWHNSLNWQSMPISYVPMKQEDLLGARLRSTYAAEIERVTRYMKSSVDDFRDFMAQLTNLTGKPINKIADMKRLYGNLLAQRNMNLTLPEWSEGIFPNGRLLEACRLHLSLHTYDANIIKFISGKLISKMTNDMLVVKEKKKIGKRDTKLFLYSAHSSDVHGVLSSLNLRKMHLSYYNDAVIIELLKEHEEYFVKVLLYYGNTSHFEELNMPGCSKLCPFEKYLANVDYLLK